MKIVNAIWELRNLGKRTIEITLEKEDYSRNPGEIYANIEHVEKEYESEYTVVKVKTGNPQIGRKLVENGFWHIETQIITRAFHDDVREAVEKYRLFYANVTQLEVSSDNEISKIQLEIERGIFTTDRIALDPVFGIEMANRRYANWVKEEYMRGGHVFYTVVDGEKIAFTLYRQQGNVRWGLLTGVFPVYARGNYGGAVLFSGSASVVGQGISVVHGAISANNHNVFALHEMFGHRLQMLQDVYTRHLN